MPSKKSICPICNMKKDTRAKTCFNCRFPKKKSNYCITCQEETYNPKFCSRPCSAIYNNAKRPKRQAKKYFCNTCGAQCKPRRKYCSRKCDIRTIAPNYMDFEKLKISDIITRNDSGKYSSIRYYAKLKYLKEYPEESCQICGYDKHIDICHIKPIFSFNPNEKIALVNHFDNLIGLCKNCHWELDRNYILIIRYP